MSNGMLADDPPRPKKDPTWANDDATEVFLISGAGLDPFIQVVTFEGEMLWGGNSYIALGNWAKENRQYKLTLPAKPTDTDEPEGDDRAASVPKTGGSLCATCNEKPQYCKGECSRCYGHRRRFGRAWPDKG